MPPQTPPVQPFLVGIDNISSHTRAHSIPGIYDTQLNSAGFEGLPADFEIDETGLGLLTRSDGETISQLGKIERWL